MPVSYIRDGDPYEGQIRRTMELVRQRLGWPEERTALSFQSKLGPVPWLPPSTQDKVAELARAGEKSLIVCPISFTADCLETLEEIGITYAKAFAAASAGGRLHLAPSLNDDDHFITALASLVRKGPHAIDPAEPVCPLRTSSEQEPLRALISRLVMVGVALPGRLENSDEITFVSEDVLRSLRRDRMDVLATVRRCADQPHVDGCLILNTCQRCEMYALLDRGGHPDRAIPGLVARFVADGGLGFEPVTLHGRDAFRRLLRTALGLNSTLPGDADVIEQLRSAGRMAEHEGTLSPGLTRLLAEAERAASSIREETSWGGYMTDFAGAAMSTLDLAFDPGASEGIIIGGSTTSRQLLRIIAADRAANTDRLTFVYRGTARKDLVKFIRRIAPHVRRLRVDRYDDAEVVGAITHADTIFLGIDAREPVLLREHIEGLRDFAARPLTIVDFNSFGSTRGLENVAGVRLVNAQQLGAAAAAYGERVVHRPGFPEAFDEAQRYVEAAACAAGWDTAARRCANGHCATCHHSASANGAARVHQNGRATCLHCL
jgi:glutamyl-tRNA reductase